MTRKDRFEQLIAEFGPTNADFARRIGMPDARHVNTILSRLRRRPENAGLDGETVAAIMKVIGVSPLWLMFGEGPKTLDVAAGDPSLTDWLGRMPDDLRAAARDQRLTISETKTLLRLLDERELRTYTTRADGAVDWKAVTELLRAGRIGGTTTGVPSDAGMKRAAEEQGTLPKKFSPEKKPKKRKRP